MSLVTGCLSGHGAGSSSKGHASSSYLADVKKSLRPSEVSLLFQTIDDYKKKDNYEKMVTTVVGLFTERDENFHLLASRCSRHNIFAPSFQTEVFK